MNGMCGIGTLFTPRLHSAHLFSYQRKYFSTNISLINWIYLKRDSVGCNAPTKRYQCTLPQCELYAKEKKSAKTHCDWVIKSD